MRNKAKNIWARVRYWIGYGLFIIYIIYSLYQSPNVLWNLHLEWLVVVVGFILLMFVVEIIQFFIFLHHHHIPLDILVPIRFTTRKSIFNSILPAKTGTLLFLHLITRHYKLEWHEYVQFMITSTIVIIAISNIVFLGLVLTIGYFLLTLIIFFVGVWLVKKYVKWGYLEQIIPLLVTLSCLYLCRLFIFWALLLSSSNSIGFKEASYFAIATNILAQVSITPGNIGIREVIFGMLAPYLSLPMSVGVIIGALFQVIRVIVYAIISVLAEVFFRDQLHKFSYDDTPAGPSHAHRR